MYDYITQYITKEVDNSLKSMSEKFYHHVCEQLPSGPKIRKQKAYPFCFLTFGPPRISIIINISSHHRLIALVDRLYSIKTENEHLNYSTNFLLERTTHNPDYNRFIVENPLDKCILQEFPLLCNWHQQCHTYMSPLFTL
ncbi:unnamed protein product [Rotaria sp. Silwood1]|nr:unnamed protein product [Rotaria sp. Silwood1]CAF1636133.1 unnamed protein product [Rotaria sp. Silwood1]CAF3568278.1 unnamed protein product [Rotaria sp. Silwood1]CAF3756328.1 unnamed protein product [Rotaria sp. Silwood1]CAF3856019.1 unnamed protein product [Rotaria sp. Silwood1]